MFFVTCETFIVPEEFCCAILGGAARLGWGVGVATDVNIPTWIAAGLVKVGRMLLETCWDPRVGGGVVN